MRGDLVIGLDSSTTATKAIAFDRLKAQPMAPRCLRCQASAETR